MLRKVKALSVRQPWASMIARGDKTIETRTWRTAYRGELLIVASKRPVFPGLPAGKAVCICELVNCCQIIKIDLAIDSPMRIAARCEIYVGDFAWMLDNIRLVEPFEVRGRLGIYEVVIDD